MTRLEKLKNLIDALYQEKKIWRADWADYLYQKHVFLVADHAQSLSERFWWDSELAVAAAMLHDIWDAVISRFDSQHEAESECIARDFLSQSDFTSQEIEIIVGDIIRNHSCRESLPMTQEWKIMATADAIIHLTSDFYNYALQAFQNEWKTLEEIRQWALPKIERDFRIKIFFDEVREEVRGDYESCKELFQG